VANHVFLDNVASAAGVISESLNIFNCSEIQLNNCDFSQITTEYEVTPLAPPSEGVAWITVANTIVREDVNVLGLAKVALTDDTQVGGDIVAVLLDNVDNLCGTVWSSGRVVGGVDIEFNFTNAGEEGFVYEVCRFDYCRIGGAFSVVGTGTQNGDANARNAILASNQTHTAGARCTMDLRGTIVDQTSLAVAGSGTIDRDYHYTSHGAAAGVSLVMPITPPFPTGAQYNVLVELADPADGAVGISAVSGTSFTRTLSADNNGGIQFVLIRTLNR
jgi:hypothetical protein